MSCGHGSRGFSKEASMKQQQLCCQGMEQYHLSESQNAHLPMDGRASAVKEVLEWLLETPSSIA